MLRGKLTPGYPTLPRPTPDADFTPGGTPATPDLTVTYSAV